MEKNLFLTAEDFAHRLNLGGFTNIEKSYTSEEFNGNFNNENFLVLEKAGVDNFIKNINEQVGGEIVKGKFNDTPEVHKLVEKAKSDLGNLQRILINDGPGTERVCFVMEKSKLAKIEDDTLEKGTSENELEKGNLIDAFDYSSNIIFKKKGSDIIEKFKANKIFEQAENDKLVVEIDLALDACTLKPTEEASLWGNRQEIKVPYKIFNWNQTYYNQNNSMHDVSESEASCRAANTPEEAEANSKYNSLVHRWIDSCVELRMIDLYADNIEDKKVYELTSRQMLALKF